METKRFYNHLPNMTQQTDVSFKWGAWHGCVIVTLVSAAVAEAVGAGTSSGGTEAWLSVGEGVGVASRESTAQICSSSRTAVDDE